MTILPAMSVAISRARGTRRLQLFRRHDRPAVLELDPCCLPGAARRSAAQRIDGHPQLVSWPDGRAVPPIAQEQAWRATFQKPELAGAVLALYVEENINVRARVAELGHRSDQLDRMLLIEHRKRVVAPYGAARGEPCTCRKQ